MTTQVSAVETTAIRSVIDVLQPVHTLEGEGFPVRRPFPPRRSRSWTPS